MTECVRSKIEEIRQKKVARHLALTSASEGRIARLTADRCRWFEKLENDIQESTTSLHPTEPVNSLSYRQASGDDIALSASKDSSVHQTSPVLLAEEDLSKDDSCSPFPVPEARDTILTPEAASDVVDRTSPSFSPTEVTDQATTFVPLPKGQVENSMDKLRQLISEIETSLQIERSNLQEMRIQHAVNVARLETLERDLCKYSEVWEMEEKARLQIGVSKTSTRLGKRKRDDDQYGEEDEWTLKKTVIRAGEILLFVSVVGSLAVAKAFYNQM